MEQSGRIARTAQTFALLVASLGFTLLAIEVALRLLPGLLPAGSYGAGSYDPELQMNTYDAPVLYNKGRVVLRVPNSAGFMDVEHSRAKPPGTLRVGVFGDSFVEALQVPLEEVFFRRLPARVVEAPLEAFGFGIQGWGTLHSLINARVQAPRYQLDIVVYAFYENDPGDSSYRVQRELEQVTAPKPYADFDSGAADFDIRWLGPPGTPTPARRIAKFVQAHSRLAQLVWQRVVMFRNQPPLLEGNPSLTQTSKTRNGRPEPDALPSTWRPDTRAHVEELTARILGRFAAEMRSQGRTFAVLYVARDSQLKREVALAETWRPWLGHVCATLGIPLIDPSEALRARMGRGDAVYGDHWTPLGHEVVAEEIGAWLTQRYGAATTTPDLASSTAKADQQAASSSQRVR